MNVFFHESLQSSLPPSSLPQLAVSPLRKVLKICQEIQKTIEAIRQSILAVQQERPSSQRPFLRLESLPAIFPYAVDKPGRPDSVSRGVISASHIQTKCRSILIQIRCAILKITLIQLVSRLRFQSSPSTKPTESLSAEFLLPNKSSSDLPSLSPTIFHNLFDKPPSLESHENPDLASESVSSFPKQSSASPQELTALIQPLPPPSLLPKQTTGLTQELFIPRTMSAPFLRPSSQSSQTLTSSSLLKRASSISEELFGLAQKSSRGSSQKSSVSTLNSTPRNLSFATTTIPSRQTASLASSASSASSVSSTSPRLRHPSREENIPLSFSEETSPRQTNSSFEISHSSWPQKQQQQQQPLFSPQGVDLKENQQARSINSSPPLALDLQQAPNLSNSNSPQYKEKETLSSRLPYPNDDASFLHDQDQQIKHKPSVDDGATVYHLAHGEISNSKTESALSFISKSASQSIDAPSKFLPFTTGKMEMNSPRTRLNEQSPDQEASATGTSTRRVESIHPTNHLLLDINTQKIPLLFLFDKSSEYFFRMMRLRTSPKTCAKFDLIISNQYDYLSKENIQVRPFPNHSSSSRDFEMVIFLLNKTIFSFPYLMNGFQNQVYYESMTRFIRLKDLFPRARILFLLKTPTPLNTEASFSVLYDNSLFLDKIDSKTVEIICANRPTKFSSHQYFFYRFKF